MNVADVGGVTGSSQGGVTGSGQGGVTGSSQGAGNNGTKGYWVCIVKTMQHTGGLIQVMVV